ncbi:alpha/beta fold hydrolase [Neptuniibacter halophilus]|uniref:alpha/beta fold hydrolase n=1 Tax=Neptuniibacter halophilus TaxID=651666 RepID=UPI002573A1D3|nr:alpha/beta hydrolase [Neptuniibacter halophilus]
MESLSREDGTTLHYISLGQGEKTLVFLHGWTASVREWLPFASELAQNHRVVCWDARGHGAHTYQPDSETSLPAMATDLESLLTHLNINDAILVGHSMGALTAWEYIRQYGQQRLAGLCLIDQSPKLVTDQHWSHGVYSNFDSQRNQRFLQRLTEDFPEAVLELIGQGMNLRSRQNYEQNSRGFQQMREYLEQLPGALLTRCWDSITQQDYRPVLAAIERPALLIYGDQSQFYSAELQQWVHQQISGSELHIYENSDHSPHLWHKERFIYDLNRFVDAL